MLRRCCRVCFRLDSLLAVSAAALILQLAWPAIVSWWNVPHPGQQTPGYFEASSSVGIPTRLGYWIYLPKDYAREAGKSWPLLLFLHGSGERGDDLNLVKRHGPPGLIDGGKPFPMIVLSPQCPPDMSWQAESLTALLDEIIARFRIDRDRVCVTGYSMGGFGAWELAAAHPDRFAAVVPVAGGGDPRNADRLKNLPVWAFHGARDETVPLAAGQAMVDAVRAAGGNAKFTIEPNEGHGICAEVYERSDLYEWLLAQRRPTLANAEPAR